MTGAETTSGLAALRPGQRLRGLVPGQTVTVIAVEVMDPTLVEVFYRDESGASGARSAPLLVQACAFCPFHRACPMSRLRRVITSSGTDLGHTAAHSPMFVHPPKPSASC